MSLERHLLDRIAADGPLGIADYMTDCLLHPRHGYYITRDPFGSTGDFITAPEISQMFGELIGLSLAQCWIEQGRPAPFTLAELGPGRGTLMADLLRAAGKVPGFLDAAEIVLVEVSPALRARQAETLSGHAPRWIGTVADLPDRPLLLVANEFFDALPIRQFLRDGPGWRERRIGASDGKLVFGLGERMPQPALAYRLEDTVDGDLVEYCAPATEIAAIVGGIVARHGGAALLVDYGDWRALGDTLQAVRGHASADPLDAPGTADLTAHVDFEALALATPSAHTRLATQGVFLERLGITQRAQGLARNLRGSALDSLVLAHRRLTHPEEMGNLFKVMGFYPRDSAPPTGLEK